MLTTVTATTMRACGACLSTWGSPPTCAGCKVSSTACVQSRVHGVGGMAAQAVAPRTPRLVPHPSHSQLNTHRMNKAHGLYSLPPPPTTQLNTGAYPLYPIPPPPPHTHTPHTPTHIHRFYPCCWQVGWTRQSKR